MSEDPYVYPGTSVLRNRFGLTDAADLDRVERLHTTNRSLEPIPRGSFDLAHLRAIHRHLFQDIYDWAGELRTVEISKGRQQFQFREFIETGMGEKWSPREVEMYGIHRTRPFADSLRARADCGPDDIDIVINTHLHFDHAGGNTVGTHAARVQDDGRAGEPPAVRPQFTNARYLVSRTEFEHAESPHERDRASYLLENWQPLIDSKQLDLMPDSFEPVEGLKVDQVRGHSETMQTIKLTRGGETLFGFFDMVPMRHHVSPAWIMSYDLFPTETLAFKKQVLPQALEGNWICQFYHDPEMPLTRLAEVNGKIQAIPLN